MTSVQIETPRPTALAAAECWRLDDAASVAEFRVSNFWGLASVRGAFDVLDGTLQVGPSGARIELCLDAGSVESGNAQRDEHLRTADFFDVERHPEVVFVSTGVEAVADDRLEIAGELTAAGRSVPVALDASLLRQGERVEIDGRTTVDRTLFGMTWSPLRMAGRSAELHVRASLVAEDDACDRREDR